MACHIRPATSREAAAISRVVLAALRESIDPAHQKGGIGRQLMEDVHAPLPSPKWGVYACHCRLQLKSFMPR